MITDSFFNKAYLYFVLGAILMMGIGAVSVGDDAITLTLFSCIAFAYFGWLGAGIVSTQIFPQPQLPDSDPIANLIWSVKLAAIVVIAAFLIITLAYGLPLFSTDPSIARLEQRNYGSLMMLVEHGLPLMLGFAMIAYQERQIGGKLLMALTLAGLVLSMLLAVRYLFFQALLVMFIIATNRMNFTRAVWNSILAVAIAIIFYVSVQLIRSDAMLDENMLNRLYRRLFIIHYEIFEKSANWSDASPYITYLSPLYKLMGENGFNLGFELFNTLEVGKAASVQGYAPVSIIGEAMINMQEFSGAMLLIASIFFFMHVFLRWLATFMIGKNAELFSAIICMEMFRAYAHSLFGFVYSISTFFLMILVISLLSTQENRIANRNSIGATLNRSRDVK